MIDCFLGDAFWVCPACFGVLLCGEVLCCRYTPYTTGPCSQWCPFFNRWCVWVALYIVDLLQYFLCCIRSGVSRCTLLMMLYVCPICHCGLHSVLWSPIDILTRLLAAEPRSTAGYLSLSQCLCGTILLTLDSIVWDWRVLWAGIMFFYWSSCWLPFCLFLFFPFSAFFLLVGILGLGSLDWLGVNCFHHGLHCRQFLI